MTAPVAGWYADPHGGPDLRYWDGTTWTASTQPTPAAVYPPAAPAATAPMGNLLARNKFTLITIAICVVYYILDRSAHVVFFGVLPVAMSFRSFQAKEPFAVIGAAIAALTIVNAFANIF